MPPRWAHHLRVRMGVSMSALVPPGSIPARGTRLRLQLMETLSFLFPQNAAHSEGEGGRASCSSALRRWRRRFMEEVPLAFQCPIGLTVMSDPVFLVQTGHTFERKNIEMHLNRPAPRCPLSGVEVTDRSPCVQWRIAPFCGAVWCADARTRQDAHAKSCTSQRDRGLSGRGKASRARRSLRTARTRNAPMCAQ